MKYNFILLLLAYSFIIKAQLPESYNIKWDSPSKNSSESMPVGGGSVGLNAWVEDGSLLFYISKSGAFDENNQLLKLGICRIRLNPNPLNDKTQPFSQELKLNEGYILFSIGKTKLKLWVEVAKPLIHVEVDSPQPIEVEASYENWRTTDRLLPKNERSACYSYSSYDPAIYTYKDVVETDSNRILFYHRNRPNCLLFDFILKQQGLESKRSQLHNTQLNQTFGGWMQGKNFHYKGKSNGSYCNIPYTQYSLLSDCAAKKHHLSIALAVAQATNLSIWKQSLEKLADTGEKYKHSLRKNLAWWKIFWERSYIYINLDKGTEDKGFQMGRNYQLFRYMLACNAYGDYPTKFNGGLFTFDAPFTPIGGQVIQGTPDYRAWGGGSHTAQNQRLVYWPMLKSGDWDMMAPQFEFYNRGLNNAEQRVKTYWGHAGCCFTEHTETFGLPAAATWGFDHAPRLRPDTLAQGILYNPWVQHHYTNQLEFSYMMLQYASYSGKSIQGYLPFIESALTFFFEHYKYREMKRNGRTLDEQGKLVIYPSTACETFKQVKNPTDISAALMACIDGLQLLSNADLSDERKAYWLQLREQIPAFTFGTIKGKRVLLPAVNPPKNINTDIPELYPLFPYGFYGVGKADLDISINTWKSGFLDNRKNHISWHQDAIFCARMGLTAEAMEITLKKLCDGKHRFPAFWGPGHDYTPDHNWGGSGMIGLQEMLLQMDAQGDPILLPAWPEDYDVSFKLFLSNTRSVEAEYKNGVLVKQKVRSKKQ